MHINEIVITPENHDDLMLEAMELGKKHVEALKEQIKRQKQSTIEISNVSSE